MKQTIQWEQSWKLAFRDYRYFFLPKSYAIRKKLLFAFPFEHETGKQIVFFDCKKSRVDGVSGRRLHHLVTLFEAGGCQVVIRASIPMCGNFYHQKFKKRLLERHSISFVSSAEEIQQSYITIADYECGRLPHFCKKWITLLFDGDYDDRHHLMLPFPLFPDAYEADSLLKYRKQKKQRGIMFAGSTQPNYDRSTMQEIYHCMPRQEAVKYLQTHLHADELLEVRDLAELHSDLTKKVFLLENHRVKISESEWFTTLAGCDFFLCLPGTRYPMCHNAVESLAIGTIPILEYPQHFLPALEDGVNCLVFHGKESLIATLRKAFAMSEEEKLILRQHGMKYYDEFLELSVTAKKILSDSREKVFLHTTYHALAHE